MLDKKKAQIKIDDDIQKENEILEKKEQKKSTLNDEKSNYIAIYDIVSKSAKAQAQTLKLGSKANSITTYNDKLKSF